MSEKNLPVKSEPKEIATLGDGEVFVRRTPTGQVKAVRTTMGLSLDDKELCPINKSNVMITTYGFDKMNRVAGLSVVYPPQINITVDRRGFPETALVENPYIEYDDDGSIRVITTECLAIGLSPIGNWCITQERLRFDLRQYFIAEAWGKVKKYPACGKFTTLAGHESGPDAHDHMWVPVIAGCGLSVNLMHKEIESVLTGHITRQKFAERIATSICRRNAMKRHPAIAQTLVNPRQGYAEVDVIGWQHDKSADEIKDIAASVANRGVVPSAIQHGDKGMSIDGKPVEIVTEETNVEYGDEENAAVKEDVSTDDMDQNRTGTGISTEQGNLFDQEEAALEEREKNLLYIGELENSMGHDDLNGVIDEIAPDTPDTDYLMMTDEQLATLVGKLKEWNRTRKR
jgi:hypothetical protein